MKTLFDLAKDMERLAERIPQASNDIKIAVTAAIHGYLLVDTPVDTSKALSNWIVTAEEPWKIDMPAYREGIQGSTQSESIDLAKVAARQQYKLVKSGESLFISNNADYILDLNNGSSRQAPAGFIEASILKGRKLTQNLKLGLRNG